MLPPKDSTLAYAAFVVRMNLATELLAAIVQVADARSVKLAAAQNAATVAPPAR